MMKKWIFSSVVLLCVFITFFYVLKPDLKSVGAINKVNDHVQSQKNTKTSEIQLEMSEIEDREEQTSGTDRLANADPIEVLSSQNKVGLSVDNHMITESTPIYEDERYVPVSIIENHLEGKVFSTLFVETISIHYQEHKFLLPVVTPNSSASSFNYQTTKEDTKASDYVSLLVDKSFYIPLRFIEEELGLTVHQDDEHTRILTSEEKEIELPLDVPLVNQMDAPSLYNGCEVASLAMILQYHGEDVTKNELADQIPYVPLMDENGLRGNPNDGFVGNMANGPGLSVYHGPIVELAQQYVGDRAIDLTGSEPAVIYDYLDKGLPVWIISTTNLAPVNDFETWQTSSGEIEVTFKVHSLAVTGYNENNVFVNDPYGIKNRMVDRTNFEKAWKQMGSQAIVIME